MEALLEAHPKLMDSIGNQKDQIVQLESPEGMRSVSIRSMPFRNQHETLGYQVIFEDVTEREALNRRLVEMANIDGLSSLNNRRRFRELGEEAYQRAVRYEEKLAVLMMDLDHFKKINDTYGHSAVLDFDMLISQADRALYQAKEQGRNRVVVFGRE